MGHSLIVSEPLALIGSVLAGLTMYAVAAATGMTPDHAVWAAIGLSVVLNVAIGAPINTVALDVLSLILVRPFSPVLGAKVLGVLLPTIMHAAA